MENKNKSNEINKRLVLVVFLSVFILAIFGTFKIIFAKDPVQGDFVVVDGVLINYKGDGGEIVIPNDVVKIENSVFFSNATLTGVKIPGTVKEIGDGAFMDCKNLKSVVLGNGIEDIGISAFKDTNLNSILIPESVKRIGYSAFSRNLKLKEISVDVNNNNYISVDGVLYNKDMDMLHSYPAGKEDSSFAIPKEVNKIINSAFWGSSNIENISFPETIVTIEDSAFMECTLKEVILNEGVSSVGDGAFSSCSSLKKAWMPDTVKSMGVLVFAYCEKLEEVRLPDGLNEIPQSTFDNCSLLKDIKIPVDAQKIGEAAFKDCRAIKTIELPDKVEEIENSAFKNCEELTTINLENVKIIGESAFKGCTSLMRVNLSEDIKYDRNAFEEFLYNQLNPVKLRKFEIDNGVLIKYNGTEKDILIPEGVKEIKNSALVEAQPIKITLPASYDSINIVSEFSGLVNLQIIELAQENKKYKSVNGVVFSSDLTQLIFYPRGKVGPYSIPEEFKNLKIGNYAFSGCHKMSKITLGNNVVAIGDGAFHWTYLREIDIPESVKDIGKRVFADQILLKSVTVDKANPYFISIEGVLYDKNQTDLIVYPAKKPGTEYIIPDGVTNISEYAFSRNYYLEKISLPDSLRTIEFRAFNFNHSIEEIFIPSGVESIGESAFDYSYSLRKVWIEDGVKSIGTRAFSSCGLLEEIRLPQGITSIPDYGFIYCSSLKQIILPSSVTKIGTSSFTGCTSLEEVSIHKNLQLIESDAFADCSSLEKINLENVKTIGINSFRQCSSLNEIKTSNNADIAEGAFEGTLWEKAKLEEFIIEDNILKRYNGISKQLIIPEGVISTTCGFTESHVRSIILPASYTSEHLNQEMPLFFNVENITVSEANNIYKSLDGVVFTKDMSELVAFPRGKTGSYIIPDGVKKIRHNAFYMCKKLDTLTIPDSVEIIEISAIMHSNISNIIINQSISRKIDHENFIGVSWENDGGFIIENNVIIGYNGLGGNVKIPYGVKEIADHAFEGKGPFIKIIIPETVTRIGNRAFANCSTYYVGYYGFSLTVEIPDSVEFIGEEAFAGSSVTSVYWPESIQEIPRGTFKGCSSLDYVDLPDNISKISENAFNLCEKLTIIHVPDFCSIGKGAFSGTPFENVYK